MEELFEKWDLGPDTREVDNTTDPKNSEEWKKASEAIACRVCNLAKPIVDAALGVHGKDWGLAKKQKDKDPEVSLQST